MKKILVLFAVLVFSFSALARPVKLMVYGDSLSVGHHLAAEDSFGQSWRSH